MRLTVLVFCCFILLTSCKRDETKRLQTAIENCINVELIFNALLKSTIPEKMISLGEMSIQEVDTFLLDKKIDANCWHTIGVLSVSFSYNEGLLAGCIAKTSSGLLIFYTIEPYWLSKRYSIQSKVSDKIFILKFDG